MTATILVLLGSAIAGIPACRLALSFAKRRQIIDHPNRRSSHSRPTPRGGGLGIVAVLAPGLFAGVLALGGPAADLRRPLVVGIGVLILAMTGYRDDRSELSARIKLPVQAAVAFGFCLLVGTIASVVLPGAQVGLGVLSIPLTLVWLVGFPNAFNFMDGIDGIAGLFAFVAATFLGVAGGLAGSMEVAALAAPVAGACLAFLTVNWPPARIFMGDVGSLPVGFALAGVSVVAQTAGGVPFVSAFLILGPFLFDTLLTLLRRLVKGENLFVAHRSHLYQRLVISGCSHRAVTLLYGVWTVLTGCLGLVYLSEGAVIRATAIAAALLSGLVIWGCVVHLEGRRKRA